MAGPTVPQSPGERRFPTTLPLTVGPSTRHPEGRGQRKDTTFSRLASGHSVSIQSVATCPIRLSLLAMFLWGQWEGERGEEIMETCNLEGRSGAGSEKSPQSPLGLGSRVQDTESKERLQDEVKVTEGTV